MNKIANDLMTLSTGSVLALKGKTILVQSESGVVTADRAAGCLLDPKAGDKVLVSILGENEAYVLSVLKRADGSGKTITFDGDTTFCVANGELNVLASEKVNIGSAGEVSVSATTFGLTAMEGKVVADNMSFVGSLFSGNVKVVKLFAKTFDSIIERLSQRLKRSYRTVEETETVRADMIHYRAGTAFVAHGENTIITAKNNIKINGDLIQLG